MPLSELRKAIRHPIFLFREANIFYHSRLQTTEFNESGTDIFEEDWDDLVLLDACRYDLFAETVDLDSSLESRISRGATSREFIRGNFTGAELHETVYVTENGWYFKLRDEIGAELHAEKRVEHDGLYPTPITDAALEPAVQYPNKRLLVHYMHPHYPYLGETATGDFDGFDLQTDGLIGDIQRREVSIPDEVMRQAYVETLDAVLNEVAKLLEVFEGKTVVSADHGELLRGQVLPAAGQRLRPPRQTVRRRTREGAVVRPQIRAAKGRRDRATRTEGRRRPGGRRLSTPETRVQALNWSSERHGSGVTARTARSHVRGTGRRLRFFPAGATPRTSHPRDSRTSRHAGVRRRHDGTR